MTTDLPSSTVRLRELAAQVTSQWLIFVVAIALVTAASLAASTLAKREYTATASLTVSPLTTNPFSTAAVNQQINITTERATLESNEVARMAAEELGTDIAPGALLKRLDVAAPSGSQVLKVSVTMPDPQEAADYANAMAGAYLRFRAEGAADVASGYIAALNEEIAKLSAIERPTEQQLQRLSEAVQQRQNLALVADNPGRIIGIASPPSEPSSLSPLSFLTAGLIGGVLLGIVAALLRQRLDGKVRSRSRLSQVGSAPALHVLDQDDTEGMRWVLRALTEVISTRTASPALVGMMPAFRDRPCPQAFTHGLADVARAAGLSVLVVKASDIDPEQIDHGWPEPVISTWQHRDLVILETDVRLAGVRRVQLADQLHAVVVLAYADSTLKDLRKLEGELDASDALRVHVLLGNGFNKNHAKERKPGSLSALPTMAIGEHERAERKEPA